MATDKDYAEMVAGMLHPENVRVKPMFGEYCLYHNDKVVAFICDNCVLLKPSNPVLPEIANLEQAEAYPGSKMYFVVPEDRLDTPWFRETVVALSDVMPAPKPKKRK